MAKVGDQRLVKYHSNEWKELVEQGWITAHVDAAEMVTMLYQPEMNHRTRTWRAAMITLNKINNNALSVTIGTRTWYFSYQTCVAYEDTDCPRVQTKGVPNLMRARRQSNYSVTTAKHMNYMGVADWPKVDDATFEKLAGG